MKTKGDGKLMKIILSRKGFDSATGGFASPILPDNRMVSLPIPEEGTGIAYSELKIDDYSTYFTLMEGLGMGTLKCGKLRASLTSTQNCHLDPDIVQDIVIRADGWRGVFGQTGLSAMHLKNQGIKEGDLFLFFGWFKKTVPNQGRIIYDNQDAEGKHVLFGYLQIGEIVELAETQQPYRWLGNHPHLRQAYKADKANTLYLAAERLSIATQMAGYGRFNFSPELVLSKSGKKRSKWLLPDIFKETEISYHSNNSWKEGYFQSAGRGQEFVLNATDDIKAWAQGIITRNAM